MSRKTRESVGESIIKGLEELRDAVKNGERISARFTVRTVELDLEPAAYDPGAVRETRRRLGVSQAILAQILAVSTETVENWEQGQTQVPPMACRLLDLINNDVEPWLELLRRSLKESGGAGRTVGSFQATSSP